MIDGETSPHVMRGINEEDDFGFGWGYHEVMTRWIGCPYHRYATRTDQDGVVYRFFSMNPVTFDSSLLPPLRVSCGRHGDRGVLLPGAGEPSASGHFARIVGNCGPL